MEATINYVITGTGAADTITTGGLADTITGGVGADTLSGGDGADTFVRNGNATTDGVDTVTFVAADDILDFTTSASLEGGAATTAYGTEGALGNIATGVGLQVFSSNITVADATVGPTEAEIETYLGANEVFFNGATGDSVYIFADDGVNTYGFLVTEGADGTNKQFDAADDVGTTFIILSGISDATTLSAANFADFT